MSSTTSIISLIKSHQPPQPLPSNSATTTTTKPHQPSIYCWYSKKFNNNNYTNKFKNITKQLELNVSITMPYSILLCIAEFATGFKEPCPATILTNWDKILTSTPVQQCTGDIYYLESDNFTHYNVNSHNCRGLARYQCNNSNCYAVINLCKCSVENCINVTFMEDKDNIYYYGGGGNSKGLCCNSQNREWRPPTASKCTKSFCQHHISTNGLNCNACGEYYCMECVHNSMGYCITMRSDVSIWTKNLKEDFDVWICKHCIWGKDKNEIPKCIDTKIAYIVDDDND